MAASRVQIILHTVDNVPANFVSNSFALTHADPEVNGDDIRDVFDAAYSGLGASTLSNVIAQNGHDIKISALPGTPPNYPYYESTFNLTSAPTGTPMPSEVACVLSFQGAREAGEIQARRRGRVYIGPLGNNGNTNGRPNATLIADIQGLATDIVSGLQALTPSPPHWSVWSTVDQDVTDVVDGWVDNAFDTQRRRGVEVTARTTFSLPQPF